MNPAYERIRLGEVLQPAQRAPVGGLALLLLISAAFMMRTIKNARG